MAVAVTVLWPLAGLAQGPHRLCRALRTAQLHLIATPLPPPTEAGHVGTTPPAAAQAPRTVPQPAPPQTINSAAPDDTAPQWPNQWVPGGAARLQVLDKIDAIVKESDRPGGTVRDL